MSTKSFATESVVEFRNRSSQPDYLEVIKDEHRQIMTVVDFGSFDNFFKKENKGKNRYNNIPCWDRTRVTVTPQRNNSDYIHANYIDSFESPKKFIATQGPLDETIEEFWQMVWEQNCYVIVMLTDFKVSGVEKCAAYWWGDGNYTMFTRSGGFLVSIISKKTKPGYVESVLEVFNNTIKKTRHVKHFQYPGWPDFKTLTNSSSFIKLVLAVNEERQRLLRDVVIGPIIVHCSAGTGRTGTFCALDSCMYQLVKTETVSVPETVMKLRSQRHSSVSASEQYISIYSVLREFLQMCDQYPNLRHEISAHVN